MAPGHYWTTLPECTCREPRSGGVYVYMGASGEIWPDISGLKWAIPSWSAPWQCHGTKPAAFNIYALYKFTILEYNPAQDLTSQDLTSPFLY